MKLSMDIVFKRLLGAEKSKNLLIAILNSNNFNLVEYLILEIEYYIDYYNNKRINVK